jgi:hypothetical protein
MGKHVQTSVLSDYVQTSALSDFSKYPSFGVATGSANAYSVTLSPAPTSYVNGFGVTVVIPADSTGTSTLNVNGLGAKTLKKANGNDVTNLKANGVYTFRYNSTTGNFILQGEGGSGNATAADIVLGKTASTDLGDIVGTATIPSLGGKRYATGTATSSPTAQTVIYSDGTTSAAIFGFLTITGLSFTPSKVLIQSTSGSAETILFPSELSVNTMGNNSRILCTYHNMANTGAVNEHTIRLDGTICYVNNGGFKLPTLYNNFQFQWTAIE